LIIIVGAYRANLGLCKVGTIVAFLTYFTIILNSLMAITRLFMMFSKATASAIRIDEVMSLSEDITVLENKYPAEVGETDFHIEFDHVNFSYNGVKNNIIDFDVKIKRGESLGIIGATGSGKSTIIRLLMRLYDIDEGEIRINGINIKEIDKSILRKMFGVVFQNDTLFEDTVYENISLGRNIDMDTIEKVTGYANIKEHIDGMSEGFSSGVAIRGANLSGGQKQRILISRALAGNPQILILDDSSSALDYRTDSQIRHAIKENYAHTTSIVIAQRVSAVKDMNQIIVLDEGKIIGKGTHEELLKNCAIYREISDSQMGGDMDA
ncbi:MAG: ABC transporter ATP-binding protein, partial [Agathobacter sp.]